MSRKKRKNKNLLNQPVRTETEAKTETIAAAVPTEPILTLVKNNLRPLILGVLIVIVIAVLLLRDQSPAARVNGELISRAKYVKELEKQSGSKVMDNLITRTLIMQEASKRHITVDNKELDAEIKRIEDNIKKQGQNIDTLLKAEGMTRDALREDLRMQKTVEKILAKDTTVTDKDIDAYLTKNPQPTPENIDTPTPTPPNRADIKQQLQQEKSGTVYQKWISDLRKKSQITTFINQ